MQSRHTIELRYLIDSKDFEIFDFNYNYYEPLFKKEFEERFKNHFRYYDICCESIERWKHMLQARLNDLYPIYKKRYEALLMNKNTNWFANKDLKVTDIQTLRASNKNTSSSSNSSDTTLSSESNSVDNSKESVLNNLNSNIDINKYLTGQSQNKNDSSTTSNQKDDSTNISASEGNNEQEIVTSHHEIGNIGITSSATLLSEYLKVVELMDLDGQMFEDMWDLFYLI